MESTHALSAMGINPLMLAGQLINFLIVWWVLKKYVFVPLLKRLDERQSFIAESMKKAESIQVKEQEAMARQNHLISQAQKQAAQVLEEVQKQSEQVRQDLLKEAQSQSDRLLVQTRQKLDQEKKQMVEEAKKEVLSLSTLLASRILNKEIGAQDENKYLQEIMKS